MLNLRLTLYLDSLRYHFTNMSMNFVASRNWQVLLLMCVTRLQHLETNLIVSRHCLVENIGVEPMTSCVQGKRSSQLS